MPPVCPLSAPCLQQLWWVADWVHSCKRLRGWSNALLRGGGSRGCPILLDPSSFRAAAVKLFFCWFSRAQLAMPPEDMNYITGSWSVWTAIWCRPRNSQEQKNRGGGCCLGIVWSLEYWYISLNVSGFMVFPNSNCPFWKRPFKGLTVSSRNRRTDQVFQPLFTVVWTAPKQLL